jgi:hypothetical protein
MLLRRDLALLWLDFRLYMVLDMWLYMGLCMG